MSAWKGSLDFSGYLLDRVMIDEYPFNWKTFIEVYLEDYHVAPFHPGLGHFVSCDDLKWEFGNNYSVQTVGINQRLQKPGSKIYEKWHQAVLAYYQGELPPQGAIWLTYYPNIMVEWYPHVLVISTVIARSPEHTTNVVEFYYPEDIALFEREFVEAEQAAYRETADEDDTHLPPHGSRPPRAAGAGAQRSRALSVAYGRRHATFSRMAATRNRASLLTDLCFACLLGRLPPQHRWELRVSLRLSRIGLFSAGKDLSALDLTLTTRQSLWMLVASLCFAVMGVCVKLGASVFSARRAGVLPQPDRHADLLFAYIRWRGWPLKSAHWRAQINRGVSGFVSQVLYFFAIGALPLATAVTLNYTSPLFFAMFLALWSGQRLRPSVIGALALGFIGVVVLLQPTLRHDQLLPALVGLGSGLLAGVAYFNVRRLGELGEPEWRTVFYFSLIATLAGTPWVLFSHPFHEFDGRGIALLLGVGVFGVAAQLAMTRAYRFGKTFVSAVAGVFDGDLLDAVRRAALERGAVAGVLARYRGNHCQRRDGVDAPTRGTHRAGLSGLGYIAPQASRRHT